MEWGEGVSPSWYYLYILKVTTGAGRPRSTQISLIKQHWDTTQCC